MPTAPSRIGETRISSYDLTGRVEVVTGGAQGIGRAVAECLIASGASVAVWDIGEAAGTDAALDAHYEYFDQADWHSVERAVQRTIATLGAVDILVNNAGIAGASARLWEYALDGWQRILRINLDGRFHCCRALVPGMLARGYGRIVNIASIAGKEGNPNAAAYSSSTAGVIALTKSLGKELAGSDIAVNAVTPAAARTAIFDQMQSAHIDYMLTKIPRGRFWRSPRLPQWSHGLCARRTASPPGPYSTCRAAARPIEVQGNVE